MDERIAAEVTSVTIGRGVLEEIADGLETLIVVLAQPGAAQVTARVVSDLEARTIPVVTRMLPDAEEAKSFKVVEETTAWMGDIGVKRDGIVVAIGGGALTDIAGFIASVYMRGIEARYVPTTLLGAVDAAIGGKTALNVGGKNLVGTFAHPDRVVIDVDLLQQLPDELLAEGMAEALKAGLIGDPGLVDVIERSGLHADLEEVVKRAVAVKLAIVEADFREAGSRAHLNFGHTIGHAVEAVAGWSHGRSVAVGMVAASAISRMVCGFDGEERIEAIIAALGLPVACPGLNRADLHRLMRMDKKSDPEGLRMVLLEGLGRPLVSHIDPATLDAGLDAIGIGDE
ncbi:MAG: 3-dehydroquinate synthase [Acidobacteria bacterium]|nr:3-dehydroquinate synthase [Acidobacteriota bacterium]